MLSKAAHHLIYSPIYQAIQPAIRPAVGFSEAPWGGLPRDGLLALIKPLNSGSNYALPLSCYATLGTGFWFSDSNTPITRTAAEIAAWSGINQVGGKVFWNGSQLACYSSLTSANERRVISWADKSTWDAVLINGEALAINFDPLYFRVRHA